MRDLSNLDPPVRRFDEHQPVIFQHLPLNFAAYVGSILQSRFGGYDVSDRSLALQRLFRRARQPHPPVVGHRVARLECERGAVGPVVGDRWVVAGWDEIGRFVVLIKHPDEQPRGVGLVNSVAEHSPVKLAVFAIDGGCSAVVLQVRPGKPWEHMRNVLRNAVQQCLGRSVSVLVRPIPLPRDVGIV